MITQADGDLLNNSRVLEEDQTRSVDEVKAKLTGDSEKNGEEEEEDEDDELAPKKAEKMENELKLKSSLFTIHSRRLDKYVQYSMNLESVLYGHEDWIYTVKFQPRTQDGRQPLVLISASIDKTIVVWKYDEENAIWIDSVSRRLLQNGGSLLDLSLTSVRFGRSRRESATSVALRSDSMVPRSIPVAPGSLPMVTKALFICGNARSVTPLPW